jgi:4-amino-4-deoxy-L-arabinose transferase-like glycosyltransferase
MTKPGDSRPVTSSPNQPTSTLWALLLGAGVFVYLLASQTWYGYAIDEASYLWVAREERAWFAELAHRPFSESFSAEALARRWHFLEEPTGDQTTHSNFNLPLSMHLMNVTWLLTAGQGEERWSARLASMLLFSLLVAVTLRVVGRAFGQGAGWGSSLFLVLSPRIIGHAHLAGTETTLSTLWWLTTLMLLHADRTDARSNKFGTVPILLSLTMATKLSGWFLAPVVAIGLVTLRPRGWVRSLLLAVLLPIPIIVLLTPTLWHDPLGGLWRYIEAVKENPWTIPSYFGGEVTTERLPGWTGFLVFAVTSPIATLVLGLIATCSFFRSSRLGLLVLSTYLLLGARVAGLLPTHDVERHFEPSLYGLAILAGIGAWQIVCFLFQRNTLRLLAMAVFLIEPGIDSFLYRAHGLCYYNRIVGGVAGAHDWGLETSYWLETMTDADWHAMLDDLPPGATIFMRPDHPGLDDLRRWGVWRSDLKSVGPEGEIYLLYAKRAAYFIFDPTTGKWTPTDLSLLAEQGPTDREIKFQGIRLMGRHRRNGH